MYLGHLVASSSAEELPLCPANDEKLLCAYKQTTDAITNDLSE